MHYCVPNASKRLICSSVGLVAWIWFAVALSVAEQIPVIHIEGSVHGFLVLQNLQGQTLADGESLQVPRKGVLTGRTIFRFRDGSLYDDTATFSQQGNFKLLTDHLIERGPSFPRSLDTLIDVPSGQVTVRYKEKDENEKVITEKLDLPIDLANGFLLTLLKNIQPTVAETRLSMFVATPKPRIVTLEIRPSGEDSFKIGKTKKTATQYVMKIKIGGIAGAIAPVLGKQPSDTHMWVLEGAAPAFVKSEGALFENGPIWRIQAAPPPEFRK